jgi:hypothetical protein
MTLESKHSKIIESGGKGETMLIEALIRALFVLFSEAASSWNRHGPGNQGYGTSRPTVEPGV